LFIRSTFQHNKRTPNDWCEARISNIISGLKLFGSNCGHSPVKCRLFRSFRCILALPQSGSIRHNMKYWEIVADNLNKAGWSWGHDPAFSVGSHDDRPWTATLPPF
jgi:hypothetical protein